MVFTLQNNNNRQSLNPVQLKKSIRVPTQKSVLITEKREKEKNIIISVNKDHKEVLNFLQELNMGEFFDNFINITFIEEIKLNLLFVCSSFSGLKSFKIKSNSSIIIIKISTNNNNI